MTALVWTIIELPKEGLSVPSLLVAVLGLAGFVVWESRVASPMVPLKLFRSRNFSGGSMSLTLVQIGNGGLMLIVTQYLQFVLDYTPTEAGLAFIPMAVASLIFNSLGATLGQKLGNRWLVGIGMIMIAVSFVVFSTVSGDFLTMGVAMFILGAGGGLAMPAAIAALMGAVPPEQAGVGSALNDTIQQMGAALGVAVLGSVLSSGFISAMPAGAPTNISEAIAVPDLAALARTAFTSAMSTTFWISAIGVVAAAVLAVVVMRDTKKVAAEPEKELALV
jgi:predicted MFS family arabinose efflux permease